MSCDEQISIEELSKRSGVEVRTLRAWIKAGLLAPPLKAGRGATYPASNEERALAVRALRQMYDLSISDIAKRFMMADEAKIRRWAREALLMPSTALLEPKLRGRPPENPHVTHDDRNVVAHEQGIEKSERISRRPEQSQAANSIERLIELLSQSLASPPPRKSKSTVWTHIPITADLELTVRGKLDEEQQDLFEQLVDHVRAVLTGGASSD